jgi:hypothetical protein
MPIYPNSVHSLRQLSPSRQVRTRDSAQWTDFSVDGTNSRIWLSGETSWHPRRRLRHLIGEALGLGIDFFCCEGSWRRGSRCRRRRAAILEAMREGSPYG